MDRERMFEDPNGEIEAKRRTLEDLFRPPIDLMFHGAWDAAKEEAVKNNKWLMVNVQNQAEFSCQVLNRDIWSNPDIKPVMKEHFIFWQVYHNTTGGERFMNFYKVHEFPNVAIIDPRTGEKLIDWTHIPDWNAFYDYLREFLLYHPSPDGTPVEIPPPLTKAQLDTKKSKVSLLIDAYCDKM